MMNLLRMAVMLAFLNAVPAPAAAQDASVANTLKRFAEAKPGEKELAFFSLDWVCSLKEAKKRAVAEERDILLILNTNITAHCNFYSGHT